MSARSFAGKVAVITGAASGIGRATALAFAREGAKLELVDRDRAGLATLVAAARTAGAAAVETQEVDVSDPAALERSAAAVSARHGGADVLINSAGVLLVSSFADTAAEDWRLVLDVNLGGVIHATRAYLPLMLRRGGGSVVNVASASAFFAPVGLAAYGTSKAAVLGLSEALRFELAPLGVRVSAVCPGFVDTPIVEHAHLRGEFAAERASLGARTTARGVPAERVASAILTAARENHAVVPVASEAWGLYLLKRLTPWLLPRLIRRFLGA